MTKFAAIKIHYDHRSQLPEHLKYSRRITTEEHEEYLRLYREEDVGGEGFHECMNYAVNKNGSIEIYLPTTCVPAQKFFNEDFIVFSVTYKEDRELPSHIVGVHAGVIVSHREGKLRQPDPMMPEAEPLYFHAEAPSDLCTLFAPPLPYDSKMGRYSPKLNRWGYGLRYIEAVHAVNIIEDALQAAVLALASARPTRKLVIERQIRVLKNIKIHYGLGKQAHQKSNNSKCSMPDKDLGVWGEKLVFERELDYAKNLGISLDNIEWVSRIVPTSPYDIKTIRKIKGKIVDFFLEVKTTKTNPQPNVYISSRQVNFMESAPQSSALVLVELDPLGAVKLTDFSLDELNDQFGFEPIKFKLIAK